MAGCACAPVRWVTIVIVMMTTMGGMMVTVIMMTTMGGMTVTVIMTAWTTTAAWATMITMVTSMIITEMTATAYHPCVTTMGGMMVTVIMMTTMGGMMVTVIMTAVITFTWKMIATAAAIIHMHLLMKWRIAAGRGIQCVSGRMVVRSGTLRIAAPGTAAWATMITMVTIMIIRTGPSPFLPTTSMTILATTPATASIRSSTKLVSTTDSAAMSPAAPTCTVSPRPGIMIITVVMVVMVTITMAVSVRQDALITGSMMECATLSARTTLAT